MPLQAGSVAVEPIVGLQQMCLRFDVLAMRVEGQ